MSSSSNCDFDFNDPENGITHQEYELLSQVMKKEEFRKLFFDYCQELNDPEQKKIYEEELTQFEKERGVDLTFINPEPGFVIKTSINGEKKCFINIAQCAKVDKPSFEMCSTKKGANWRVPLIQSPPHRDYDKQKNQCIVYDVVFHPDALKMSDSNKKFREIVIDSALDAVQNSFKVDIDRTNLKYPKIKFKGYCRPTIIRKRVENYSADDYDKGPLDHLYPPIPGDDPNIKKENSFNLNIDKKMEYAIPKYKIVQRRTIDLQECVEDQNSKLNVVIPDELVITIELPLLRSANDTQLDVTDRDIKLVSEIPAKYKLNIHLPYEVNENDGTAKFDKIKKRLIVTLPVNIKYKNLKFYKFDENNLKLQEGRALVQEYEADETIVIENETISNDINEVVPEQPQFLDSSISYKLPPFKIEKQTNKSGNYNIEVKLNNIDRSSLEFFQMDQDSSFIHFKFFIIGPGFFPVYYSLFIQFYGTTVKIINHGFDDERLIISFEAINKIKTDDMGDDVSNEINYSVGTDGISVDDVD